MISLPTRLKRKEEEVTYFKLNNQLNIPSSDGSIPLHKDKEAVRAFFLEHVNPDTVYFGSIEEKIETLIEQDYIEKDMIDNYEFSFIKSLFDKAYAKKFRFGSFMGAYKFYNQYAMKTDDGKRYLERYEDRVVFNALFLAQGDERLAENIVEEIMEHRFQPATPTFLNAGKKRRGELVSCFLLAFSDDMNDIGRGFNSVLQLSRLGGGIGVSLTDIRAAGDPIKGIEGAASGVIPVMKILEDSLSYSNQLGQRQGAGAVYLNIFHPDVIDFLSTKKENADEKIRMKTLSLGLVVPDMYYELIKNDEMLYMFSPYDVEKEYGKPFSQVDITKEYRHMVANPRINKSKIKARVMENEISKLQQESGYPYILNVDTANRTNPIDGKIIMSNLCSEILQVQELSEINADQTYKKLGSDISCNLGSTNITNLIQSDDFARSIDTAVRGLTTVTDKSSITEVPSVQNGNKLRHTIGLGGMGLHTAFATHEIMYGSPESIEFTDAYFRTVNYYSLVSSMNIAKERKETFYKFEKSKYADGTYFDKYLNEPEFKLQGEKVKTALAKLPIPTKKDWEWLKEEVMKHGLYHQNRQAIAPK